MFIASRQSDQFDGARLSALRVRLKNHLDAAQLLGYRIFATVISEDGPTVDLSEAWWVWSQNEVSRADVVIVLSNGVAGTVPPHPGTGAGICHAEYTMARSERPTAHFVIRLAAPAGYRPAPQQAALDAHYEKELADSGAQTGTLITTAADLERRIDLALEKFVLEQVFNGLRATATQFDRGPALKWTSQSFAERREAMRAAVAVRLGQVAPGLAKLRIGGADVLFICDAIPAALSIASAREAVGQPFLRDSDHVGRMQTDALVGPVHVVACHRSVSEAQALRTLGLPDATVLKLPWGVFLADELNKVQILFLANCRDEYSTRGRVDAALGWLADVGEEPAVAARATSRRRIVEVIAAESP